MNNLTIFSLYPELKIVNDFNKEMRGGKSFVLRSSSISNTIIDAVKKYYKEYSYSHNPKFNNNNPTIIEIGFGNGDALFDAALNNKNKNYIGFEVYLHGFCECLKNIGDKNLKNVRIDRFDIHDKIDNFDDESIEGVRIFFPDPWPKRKHRKRRIITKEFVEILVKKLKTGGFIHFATDIQDYAEETLFIFSENQYLKNKFKDYAPQDYNRIKTSFEKKALKENRNIYDVFFIKV